MQVEVKVQAKKSMQGYFTFSPKNKKAMAPRSDQWPFKKRGSLLFLTLTST